MPAVLIKEPIADGAVAMLRSKGFDSVKLYAGETADPADTPAAIVRAGYVDAAWMDRWPNLKIIAYHGVGTDDIDLDAARARGICVTTTPGQNSLSVAEHALALMMALAKSLPAVASGYRQQGFGAKYDYRFGELAGRTLGLVGLGDIGRRVARMASLGFDMRVIAYDPYTAAPPPGVTMTEDRMAVFREGDFISLHLPMSAATAHTVSHREFAAMRPTAFLINCARGGIVDEAALILALREGRIAGAGLDVTDPEPCSPDSPLLHMPNVILTPHVAASTGEALDRVANMCVSSILGCLAGQEPAGRVV